MGQVRTHRAVYSRSIPHFGMRGMCGELQSPSTPRSDLVNQVFGPMEEHADFSVSHSASVRIFGVHFFWTNFGSLKKCPQECLLCRHVPRLNIPRLIGNTDYKTEVNAAYNPRRRSRSSPERFRVCLMYIRGAQGIPWGGGGPRRGIGGLSLYLTSLWIEYAACLRFITMW